MSFTFITFVTANNYYVLSTTISEYLKIVKLLSYAVQ